ncbi:MAG: hypothetical protein M1358_20620 [Chloroflexi bacterium]|nr:hypothetical protein [Chloroflexota bacterium]
MNVGLLEIIKLWIAISSGALIVLHIAVMPSIGIAAKRSASELVRGRPSRAFYLGAVFFGLLVPIVIGVFGYATELPLPLLGIVGLSFLIGDSYHIYCIAKVGFYRPLLGESLGRLL